MLFTQSLLLMFHGRALVHVNNCIITARKFQPHQDAVNKVMYFSESFMELNIAALKR